VVNIDGHGTPTEYPGIAPDRLPSELDRLQEAFDAQERTLAAPLSDAALDFLLANQRGLASRVGAPEEDLVESFRRGLEIHNGQTYLRPRGEALAAIRRAVNGSLLDGYQELRCPALLLVATELLPEQAAFAELISAQQRGIYHDLTRIAEHRPNLRVVDVAASHGMVLEKPTYLAKTILDFLTAGADRPQ
jgi:pimeloyl-ACP methyl ester carboxylesterase